MANQSRYAASALCGGKDDIIRQTQWLADACRNTPPRAGFERVRLPGESGLRQRAHQLSQGVSLYPTIIDSLAPWSRKYGVRVPAALS